MSTILDDLAEELVTTALIGFAGSFITFGVGAVAATAKAAHSVIKFAKIIRTAITTWTTSKNISNGVKKATDLPGIRQALQRIKNKGRRSNDENGSPPPQLKIPPDAPARISGYTKHAEDQITGRDGGVGVHRQALEEAFANPVKDVERLVDAQGRVSFRYTGEDATVAVNAEGRVITGWANNSSGTGGAGG